MAPCWLQTLNNKGCRYTLYNTWQHIPAIFHVCLFNLLTGTLPVCVHVSERGEVKRTEDGKRRRRRSAVSQCWLSKELMEAGGKTLGGMEPCTIQASFRWSAAAGAKHPKSSAAHLKSTRGGLYLLRWLLQPNSSPCCSQRSFNKYSGLFPKWDESKVKQAHSCYKNTPMMSSNSKLYL